MKRLLIVPLFLALAASAQTEVTPSRKAFSFGPLIGMGHSWISPYDHAVFMPCTSTGVFAIYSPLEHWGVGMDVRYSQEGSRVDVPELGIIQRRINYLRVPIRAIYFARHQGDRFRPKITFGPELGFNVGKDAPPYTSINGFDFGFNLSGGFNFRMYRGTWLNLDAGWYQGVNDVILHTGMKETNGNVQVSLGVGLEI